MLLSKPPSKTTTLRAALLRAMILGSACTGAALAQNPDDARTQISC